MNVGEALTTHVEDRLTSIAEKYFSRSIEANTVFSKENHLHRVDIHFHANQGIQLQARSEAEDVYAAFDAAADKVEKQLRRYKRRLKNHHAAPAQDAAYLASHTVIAPEADDTDDSTDTNGYDPAPVVIAETKREIPKVSVGDAVMLMDLGDCTTFMFRNSKSDQLEVVYRRTDGNIGWISPGQNGA